MELALNLVWAGLAAALVVLWCTRATALNSARRTSIEVLALVCLICILFPVISMSDDLSASPAEPETQQSTLAVQADFLVVNTAPGILVHDPHESWFCHQVETQPDYRSPVHSYLSFLLTRRPPPSLAIAS